MAAASGPALQPMPGMPMYNGQAPPMQRVMLCPRPCMPPPQPRVVERVVQRPVVRQRVKPRYIVREVAPPAPPPQPSRPMSIVIHDRRPPPRAPPPPPVFIMAPPQQCQPRCPQVTHYGRLPLREATVREPTRTGDPAWFGRISHLDDESLYGAATLAAAALAAPDDAPTPRGEDVIEVTCPSHVCPGDSITVRLPAEVGGGEVRASVPAGVSPGEVFEVPLGRPRHRRR